MTDKSKFYRSNFAQLKRTAVNLLRVHSPHFGVGAGSETLRYLKMIKRQTSSFLHRCRLQRYLSVVFSTTSVVSPCKREVHRMQRSCDVILWLLRRIKIFKTESKEIKISAEYIIWHLTVKIFYRVWKVVCCIR